MSKTNFSKVVRYLLSIFLFYSFIQLSDYSEKAGFRIHRFKQIRKNSHLKTKNSVRQESVEEKKATTSDKSIKRQDAQTLTPEKFETISPTQKTPSSIHEKSIPKEINVDAEIVYLILSNFNETKQREEIRNSWVKRTNEAVVFILPERSCEIPVEFRNKDNTCDSSESGNHFVNKTNIDDETPKSITKLSAAERIIQKSRNKLERKKTIKALTEKFVFNIANTTDATGDYTKFIADAIDWSHQSFKNLKWLNFVKVELSEFNPEPFECTLHRKDENKLFAIGQLRQKQLPVPVYGTRREMIWKTVYPTFLKGGVSTYSKAVVEHIHNISDRINYEYAEPSIGIWLSKPNEVRDNMNWIDFDVMNYQNISSEETKHRQKRLTFDSTNYKIAGKTIINKTSEIVYMVISRRGDTSLRSAVRKTWARRILGSVIFPVAGAFCPWESSQRSHWSTCDQSDETKCYHRGKNTASNLPSQKLYTEYESSLQANIFSEQNVLEISGLMDSYHNLTIKQLHGFKWISGKYPKMKWLVKIDIDTHPNVESG